MPRPRSHPDHPLHPGASPGPRPEPPDRTAVGLARAGSAPVAPDNQSASDPAFRGRGAAAGAGALPRPRWRGRLHLAAFVASLPAGIALCATASSTSARIAVAVYSVTVSAVFGVSAAFHLVAWSPAGRRRMDRLDRAMIYLQIAGTYTP
jgi:hemolysin III